MKSLGLPHYLVYTLRHQRLSPGEIFEIALCGFIFGGFTLLGEDPTLKPQRSRGRK
jgi:hypothetical protein